MNTDQILSALIAERDRINRAIQALGKGSGNGAATTGRKERTPEQRAAQAEKMRAYWASKKATKKTSKSK